ncbi:MAG: hypothetical protein CVT49_07560 [candidate division Zixibacteria bacterium HGW-Zixibacteria-1]|nr:MAG: hypothetical protein CVT49_07560 [candidate division Zixibacteria bacterium HGW-Zixibacteria-1]
MDRKRFALVIALTVAVLTLSAAAWAGPNNDAWMGIYTQTVDPDLKEAFNLDSDHGVVVKMVVPDSPADRAGLKQGDIILMLDDQKLVDADDLVVYVQNRRPGDKVNVEVNRQGVAKTIEVQLGQRDNYSDDRDYLFNSPNPAPHSFSRTYKFYDSKYADSYIGVTLQSLNAQLGEYFGVADGKGALITEVMPDSPAGKAGLKAGDVVVAVDGGAIGDPSDVQKAVTAKNEGDKIEVKVIRDRGEKQFAFEVEKSPDTFQPFGNFWVPDNDEDMIFLPRMKGLFQGDFDQGIPDMKELQEQMKQLQEELKKMQDNMNEMQKKHE